MTIADTEGQRTLEVDGWNRCCPDSVFISSDGGFCMELDRDAFMELVAHELGMIPVWRVAAAIAA